MNTKLYFLSFFAFLSVLLCNGDQTEVNVCPTSRRLLLFGGFEFPFGQKKNDDSSSKSATNGVKNEERSLAVFYRPQTSKELGRKVRSYSYLLRPKLYSKEERTQMKKDKREAKLKKKKNQTKSALPVKTRELIAVDDEERDRCRTLLQLEHHNGLVPIKEQKKKKKVKEPKPPKVKVEKTKRSDPQPVKTTTEAPPVRSTPPPPLPKPVLTEQSVEDNDIDSEEKNTSVVGRAYHFVKNMFQLSDDILDANRSTEDDNVLNTEQHRQTRKLLSLLGSMDERLFDPTATLSKRQLLAVKTHKQTTKEKRTNPDGNKPKVGWAYRYRISRFFDEQKGKKNTRNVKTTGGGKGKASTTATKTTPSKGNKRKLLDFDSDITDDEDDEEQIVDSVAVMENFLPKRQLLAAKGQEKSKTKKKHHEEVDEEDDDDDNDEEKVSKRRQMKSYDELTDPVAIVESYDKGLFKPRVGWQFRYRVSRYIDSLRDNIREDQERLKLGLQAIKRKTPQELSGRRKRVLDKPFTPEPETVPVVEDHKPHVGWRYRYRVSKMLEAKQRGEYVDDEEEKRKTRVGQKKIPGRPVDEDDECVEWENDSLDPELRKIGEEGRKVGWAYRYRIRRKLDDLKQRHTETGLPLDMETLSLGGKREKKVATSTATEATPKEDEKPVESNKKAVGWQYRYRVSKMLEAQKHEDTQRETKTTSRKRDPKSNQDENLDPELAQLTAEQRVVGWAYRYRIRRKLDAIQNATRDSGAGKRSKKSSDLSTPRSSKRKQKEKIIDKVEESIEKILNIEDIDETPFMEYFRRTSSYVLFGLVPTARKSICLLPLPVAFSFCNEDEEDLTASTPVKTRTTTTTATPTTTTTSTKKERVKKEKRSTPKAKKPVTTSSISEKPAKKVTQARLRPPTGRRVNNEQVKHFDEEEQPIRKRIGVEKSKQKNRKRFQIIGQEVKAKVKHATPTSAPPVVEIPSTTAPPVTTTTTTTAVPVTTTTTAPPPPPPTTTAPPPPPTTTAPPPPPTTTAPPPVVVQPTSTIAPRPPSTEVNQEEASSVLSSTVASTLDESKEEISESLADVPTPTGKTDKDDEIQSTSSTSSSSDDDDDDDDESSDSSDTEDNDEETEEKKENFDPLALKKMKKLYENAKESVHGVFDLKDENASA